MEFPFPGEAVRSRFRDVSGESIFLTIVEVETRSRWESILVDDLEVVPVWNGLWMLAHLRVLGNVVLVTASSV